MYTEEDSDMPAAYMAVNKIKGEVKAKLKAQSPYHIKS